MKKKPLLVMLVTVSLIEMLGRSLEELMTGDWPCGILQARRR